MKVKLKIKQVNRNTENSSLNTLAPLSEESGMRGTSFNWGKLLKILIALLTALAGSLGIADKLRALLAMQPSVKSVKSA